MLSGNMDDLQKKLESAFTSDAYKKVSESIKQDFMLSAALLDETQSLRDTDWIPVREPVTLNGKPWHVFVFRHATATNILPKPVYLTFVRLAPPDSIKLALQTLAKEDAAWQSTVTEYSAAATSDDLNRVKGDLMQMFESKIFPGKEFHFVPDPQAYGMLPHFDFDLVIPFISLPSLIQNSK